MEIPEAAKRSTQFSFIWKKAYDMVSREALLKVPKNKRVRIAYGLYTSNKKYV